MNNMATKVLRAIAKGNKLNKISLKFELIPPLYLQSDILAHNGELFDGEPLILINTSGDVWTSNSDFGQCPTGFWNHLIKAGQVIDEPDKDGNFRKINYGHITLNIKIGIIRFEASLKCKFKYNDEYQSFS